MSDNTVKAPTSGEKPPLKARWFYARGKGWAIFTNQDDAALEAKWNELGGDAFKRKPSDLVKPKEQEKTGEENHDKRPGFLRAPPSGVDAVQRAMANFLPKGTQEKPKSESKEDANDNKSKSKERKVQVNEILDPSLSPSHPSRRTKVPVLEDKLFDADLETMTMYPVFFKGSLLQIVRATYFYSSLTDGSYAPIGFDEPLARDLEETYGKAKPWLEGQNSKQDPEKENMIALASLEKESGKVKWESAVAAKLLTVDLRGRFLSILGGSLVVRGFDEADRIAKEKSSQGFLDNLQDILPFVESDDDSEVEQEGSDTKSKSRMNLKEKGETRGARRGRRKTGASKLPRKNPADPDDKLEGQSSGDGQSFASRLWPSNENSIWLSPVHMALRLVGLGDKEARAEEERRGKDKSTQAALAGEPGRSGREDEDVGAGVEEDLADSPPELVLCIHGIGQQLATDFDALDFVYDVERMRKTSRKKAALPEIRRLARGRRVQFIPICWRSGLEFDEQPDGNDNFFKLEDVSNDATIPIIRNVVTKVILDVPFYLSKHREKMLGRVRNEVNRIYRLFVQRNPDFEERGGRVSLICHSLGSALGTDLLSVQPTEVKPLREWSSDELKNPEYLLFNVKHCFFIGSPVGFFMYLDGGQLIARKDNKRTKGMDDEAVSDQVGKYGCLATETLFNCFHTSDPVSYSLSAACDSKYAKLLKPISISDAAKAMITALNDMPRLSITKIFEQYKDHPFDAAERGWHSHIPSALGETGDEMTQTENKKRQRKASKDARDVANDVGWEALQKGEKRFQALNPFGCLDFVMDSEGFSEYFDMLMAHNSYWTNESFNLFVLACLFTDESKVRLAPRFDGIATPLQVEDNGLVENATPEESKPRRKNTQPFQIMSPQEGVVENPFLASLSLAEKQAAPPNETGLCIWAVDVSGFGEKHNDAVVGGLGHELLSRSPRAAQKVNTYVRRIDKIRSLAGQLLPRLVYAEKFGCRWDSMRFAASQEGRPYLESPVLESTTDYNVTHDGDWVAIAFHQPVQAGARAADSYGKADSLAPSASSPAPLRVGIDVMARVLPKYEPSVASFVETMDMSMTEREKEWVRAANPQSTAARKGLLSQEEQKARRAPLCPPDKDMLARQFDLWTHKEAFTKNLGKGLGFDFTNVELAFWNCSGQRNSRRAEKPILQVKGSIEDKYRFVEVDLPVGAHNKEAAKGTICQLVVAEGPFEQAREQIQPSYSSAEAQKAGLLRIFTMEELIDLAKQHHQQQQS